MTPELTEEANDVHSSIGTSWTIGLSEAGLEDGTSTFQLGTGVLQLIFTSLVRSLPGSLAAQSTAFKEHSRLTANILLNHIFKPKHTMSSRILQL